MAKRKAMVGEVETNGGAETVRVARGPRDPARPRSYYAVIGKARSDGAETILASVTTRRRADAWVEQQSALLRMLVANVRVVRARVVATWGA